MAEIRVKSTGTIKLFEIDAKRAEIKLKYTKPGA